MSEDQNIEQSQEDSKSERPEEVNENIAQEQTIEQTETINPTSEISTSEIKNLTNYITKNYDGMKKLFFILFVALNFSCNNNQQPATANSANANSDSIISLPFIAQYSSNFILGKRINVLTVLNAYKAWETGDMNALKNALADSVTFSFDDGSNLTGNKDSIATYLKKFIDNVSSVEIKPDGWVSLHSVDKNEDWVAVWLKENVIFKNGKSDSAYYEEDWKIDNNGKIVYVESQKRKLK